MNKLHLNNLFWFGLLITVLSVLINLLFFALTQALGEQYIIPFTESTANAAPMPVLMVVIATAIPALLAFVWLPIQIYSKSHPALLPICGDHGIVSLIWRSV
jgi:type IV secretory pathway TrbL component